MVEIRPCNVSFESVHFISSARETANQYVHQEMHITSTYNLFSFDLNNFDEVKGQ